MAKAELTFDFSRVTVARTTDAERLRQARPWKFVGLTEQPLMAAADRAMDALDVVAGLLNEQATAKTAVDGWSRYIYRDGFDLLQEIEQAKAAIAVIDPTAQ